MVEAAYSTLREVDTVLFMVPADEPRGKGDDMIIERLKVDVYKRQPTRRHTSLSAELQVKSFHKK